METLRIDPDDLKPTWCVSLPEQYIALTFVPDFLNSLFFRRRSGSIFNYCPCTGYSGGFWVAFDFCRSLRFGRFTGPAGVSGLQRKLVTQFPTADL